jgi:hypothetical protein
MSFRVSSPQVLYIRSQLLELPSAGAVVQTLLLAVNIDCAGALLATILAVYSPASQVVTTAWMQVGLLWWG